MSNIKINTTFAGAAAGFLSAAPLKSQIIAIPTLVSWIQADPAHLALTGSLIDKWKNLKDGSDAFTKYSDTSRAEYTTLDGLAGYGSGFFRGADQNVDGQVDAYTSAYNINNGDPYTFAAVFRRGASTTPDQIIGKFTDASTRAILNCAAPTTISLLHGTSAIIGPIKTNSQWNTVIASFDGSMLRMTVNGVDIEPVIASGNIGTGLIYLGALNAAGQAFDGNLAEAGIFRSCILSSPPEKQLKLDFWRTVYGL